MINRAHYEQWQRSRHVTAFDRNPIGTWGDKDGENYIAPYVQAGWEAWQASARHIVSVATGRPIGRDEVYAAIDDEREYQEAKWGERSKASVTEFLAFSLDYVMQGLKQVTRSDEPGSGEVAALHSIRKIAAMGVACMEQHGAPMRPRH